MNIITWIENLFRWEKPKKDVLVKPPYSEQYIIKKNALGEYWIFLKKINPFFSNVRKEQEVLTYPFRTLEEAEQCIKQLQDANEIIVKKSSFQTISSYPTKNNPL